MYFFYLKRLLILFSAVLSCISLISQESVPGGSEIYYLSDTLTPDTSATKKIVISPDAIDRQVVYSCSGLKKTDLINKRAILRDKAKVTYGDIEITADSIVFNMASNTLFATGIRDTAGVLNGKPVFREKSQEFEADSLTYNFRSKKALVYNIVTKQEEGLLRSSITKLLDDGTSNISRSTYSTCDAEVPHFYINLPRAKIYPGKKIISGPGNLVLEGIPLPLAIPFGFFPIQTKRAASGIIVPRIGQEQQRGYSLTEGGYYFAINDYFDLALKGNIYTNGTWMMTATTNYNKLYKYSGNFTFSYASNVSGHKGLPDYRKAVNYRLGWTYTQNPKARPGSRFSASVNMSSSGFDRTNSYVVSEHVTTQRQSSVSYSKTWEGTPFNLTTSMNHSQNVSNKTVSVNLPKLNFNMARIYPLKSRRNVGRTKWYQELQFQYSASLDNQIDTYDSLLFKRSVWDNMRNGFKHEAPLSIQFRPFRNFSISPQVSYTGVLYTRKIIKNWNPEYFNPEVNKIVPAVVNDTLRGLFYGHALKPSISASFNPQIFGMYTFRPESRIQAVRHVMKPSVGFSYIPSFKGLSTDMYRTVQTDTSGRTTQYSIFEGGIFGTPSLQRRSSSINFSIVNIIEAKVFSKNDTTGKPQKVRIIDNLSISTSYNVFADSMRWAPVVMSLRTTLFKNLNVSANTNFSLYGLNSKGQQIAEFYYSQHKKLMRLTSFSLSLDFDMRQLLSGNKSKQGRSSSPFPGRSSQVPGGGAVSDPSNPNASGSLFDEYGYQIFDVPWTMAVSYSMSYSKLLSKPQVSQTLSLNGSVTLTKKMGITYTTGYDFAMKQITMTQIGISRDLHCWDMSFNWIPNGSMKMWNFTIRAKAAILSDLKYERRKDYHDYYY